MGATMESGKSYDLNIVFIGDSVTAGALLENPGYEAPPAKAVVYLGKQSSVNVVGYVNLGMNGCTTADYQPHRALFRRVVRMVGKFKHEGMLVFSVMLGANDSAIAGPTGAPASPAKYYSNMGSIVDALLELYPDCKVVLNRPIWYSGNTYNAAKYLEEGLERLKSYYFELESLVLRYSHRIPGQVFMGDTDGFEYFEKNYLTDLFPEEGNAGVFYLHPNARGAAVLGEYWGKAILKALGDPA